MYDLFSKISMTEKGTYAGCNVVILYFYIYMILTTQLNVSNLYSRVQYMVLYAA